MPDSGTISLIPLPSFPPWLGSNFSQVNAGFRRFGISESDLKIDFRTSNRAALITRLLESCTIDADKLLPASLFSELPIGNRIECLLLLAAGGSDAALDLVFKCKDCGEELELELTINELSELQRSADEVETVGVRVKGRRLEFRKPTGADQENWSQTVFQDERDAAKGMICSLAITSAAPKSIKPEFFDAIEDAFDEADPLVNFGCSVTCDECGKQNEFAVDLVETALDLLNRAQYRLMYSVHKLATHYHWSEAEIFAVPYWRRQEYLKMIETMKR